MGRVKKMKTAPAVRRVQFGKLEIKVVNSRYRPMSPLPVEFR
jgi:hypothetical protein